MSRLIVNMFKPINKPDSSYKRKNKRKRITIYDNNNQQKDKMKIYSENPMEALSQL